MSVYEARTEYLIAAWCSDIYRRLPDSLTDWDSGRRLQLLTDAASIALDNAVAARHAVVGLSSRQQALWAERADAVLIAGVAWG